MSANGANITAVSREEAETVLRQLPTANLAVRSNVSGYLAARDTFYVRLLHLSSFFVASVLE